MSRKPPGSPRRWVRAISTVEANHLSSMPLSGSSSDRMSHTFSSSLSSPLSYKSPTPVMVKVLATEYTSWQGLTGMSSMVFISPFPYASETRMTFGAFSFANAAQFLRNGLSPTILRPPCYFI